MSHSLHSIRRVAIAAVVLLVSIAGTVVGIAGSADAHAKPVTLNHFVCYQATGTGFTPPTVILRNQFNPYGFSPDVLSPDLHCNPVAVSANSGNYPITNANAHLLCFAVTAPVQPTYLVKVKNEFGRFFLETGQPSDLCLPTWKSLTGPPNKMPNQPPGLDHFTCYPVNFAPQQPGSKSKMKIPTADTIGLTDQFGFSHVAVIPESMSLCVPTTKIVGAVTYKPLQPTAHLLCMLVSQTPFVSGVWDQNQFGTGPVNLYRTLSFCLPSTKIVIRQLS